VTPGNGAEWRQSDLRAVGRRVEQSCTTTGATANGSKTYADRPGHTVEHGSVDGRTATEISFQGDRQPWSAIHILQVQNGPNLDDPPVLRRRNPVRVGRHRLRLGQVHTPLS
jgi:hypothetical protein